MKTVPLESAIVKRILTWLNQQEGIKAEKTHGGMYSKAGKPDITGCINGRRFEFEVKRPGNKPTKLQLKELREWEAAGAIIGVVYSLEDVKEILSHV
jgi:penicillin-binding protein-related factor A (putative recombinase)